MPMGVAQHSLFGLSAFRHGQYTLASGRAQAAASQQAVQNQYNAMQSAQHAALGRLLHAQQGVDLRTALTAEFPKNRRGQTKREWLDALDARIGIAEASGFPIPPVEMADIEIEAAEWEEIYER